MSALLVFYGLLALAAHVAEPPAVSPTHEVEAPVEHTHPEVPTSDEVVAADIPAVAAVIAACESGEIRADGSPVVGTYSLTAEHPVSSASGKYQFIDSTWGWVTGLEPPASAYQEDVQDEAFIKLWDGGAGASHWRESWGCMGWEGRP